MVLGVATWLRQISYVYWAVCVTARISLLYSWFGVPADGLLRTRLEGIAVGAVIGIAASWLILPVRTSAVLRRRCGEALAALSDVIITDWRDPGELRRRELALPPVSRAGRGGGTAASRRQSPRRPLAAKRDPRRPSYRPRSIPAWEPSARWNLPFEMAVTSFLDLFRQRGRRLRQILQLCAVPSASALDPRVRLRRRRRKARQKVKTRERCQRMTRSSVRWMTSMPRSKCLRTFIQVFHPTDTQRIRVNMCRNAPTW